jgi:hypothetical protein
LLRAGEIFAGWWVLAPEQRDLEAAQALSQALAEAGAGDRFVVTDGAERGAVSLGLFTTPQRAERRADEVRELGFEVEIRERWRERALAWAVLPAVRLPDQFPEPAGGHVLEQRPVACPPALAPLVDERPEP